MAQREVFSEQQVTDIIRRATELSEKGPLAEGYTPGITREDLDKIANEIGVDPRCLEQAILESRQNTGRKPGFHLSEEYERVVDGELDPSEYDLILEFVRTVGRFGPQVSQVGRSIRARAWAGGSPQSVTVTSRNGRTKVKVRSIPAIGMIVGGYSAFLGSILTAPPLLEHHQYGPAFTAFAAFIAMGVGIGGVLIRMGQRGAQKLADRIRERIEEELAAKADSSGLPQPQGEEVESRLRQDQS